MSERLESRLDQELVARGLLTTRSKAQRLIRAGRVLVDGAVIDKPSHPVDRDTDISVDTGDDYVSRGAYKLLGAFRAFAGRGLVSPQGLDCLDIGASTGGFCDVLLRAGARRVIALDVGHGQLDPRIASDRRVIEMSGVNIRTVSAQDLPYAPQMVVSDVSFISLTYVIPVIRDITAVGAHVVLLVKPQFEVGRHGLGHHGVVRDPELRERSLATVAQCARQCDLEVAGTAPSPILGASGNAEYLLYARRR